MTLNNIFFIAACFVVSFGAKPAFAEFDNALQGDWSFNLFLSYTAQFRADSTAQFTYGATGVTYLDFDAAIEFDQNTIPKRMIQTVTKVNYEVGGQGELKEGMKKFCIYQMNGNAMFKIHCNETDFPASFDERAQDMLIYTKVQE